MMVDPAAVPGIRTRIRNNVKAIAAKKGQSEAVVWRQLYQDFEYLTNTPWRKLAFNEGVDVLALVARENFANALLREVQEMAAGCGLVATPKEPDPCQVCGQPLDIHS